MTLPSGYVTTWPSAGAEYTPTSRVGATSRPVSSRTSRASASDTDSPGSTLPPGRPQSPLSLRRCSRTPSPARMIADTPGRITMTRHCTDAVDAGQPAVVQAKMRGLGLLRRRDHSPRDRDGRADRRARAPPAVDRRVPAGGRARRAGWARADRTLRGRGPARRARRRAPPLRGRDRVLARPPSRDPAAHAGVRHPAGRRHRRRDGGPLPLARPCLADGGLRGFPPLALEHGDRLQALRRARRARGTAGSRGRRHPPPPGPGARPDDAPRARAGGARRARGRGGGNRARRGGRGGRGAARPLARGAAAPPPAGSARGDPGALPARGARDRLRNGARRVTARPLLADRRLPGGARALGKPLRAPGVRGAAPAP